MTAVDRWDYALTELLDQDAALGHPAWCDRATCSVELERDGGLTGFHESRRLAAVAVETWQSGDIVFSVSQFATDSAPVVSVVVSLDDVSGTIPLGLDDVGPLLAAITAAAEVAR